MVKVVALLKTKDPMTPEELTRRWVDRHSPIAARFPHLRGYRINVCLPPEDQIEDTLPYDGTAELWWDSLEEMRSDFAGEVGRAALADADEFSTRVHLVTEEHVIA